MIRMMRAILSDVRQYLDSLSCQAHRMVAGLKIRAAKFRYSKTATLVRELQMNDTIGFSRDIAVVRSDNQGGPSIGRETEERLDKTVMVKGIASDLAKVAETIDEDAPGVRLFDRLRNLQRHGFAFNLRRCKDVVGLYPGK